MEDLTQQTNAQQHTASTKPHFPRSLCSRAQCQDFDCDKTCQNGPHSTVLRVYIYRPGKSPHVVSTFSLIYHSHTSQAAPFIVPPMNTRKKNKSAHPGVPDMTRSQLASTGLSRRCHQPAKKKTKDQQIAALQEELRITREYLASTNRDDADDTEVTTDEEAAVTGTKRKASGSVQSAQMCVSKLSF